MPGGKERLLSSLRPRINRIEAAIRVFLPFVVFWLWLYRRNIQYPLSLQRGQGIFGAGVRLHIVGNIDQYALLVNHKVAADDAHIRFAVIRLLAPRAIHLRDAVIRIHQQGEGQIVLFLELLVALHPVRADAEDDGILGCDLFVILAEPASLDRSTSGVVFWIEVEDDFRALIVGQFNGRAAVGERYKVGRGHAGFKLCHTELLCGVDQ